MQFGNTRFFDQALEGRYGTSSSIRDFVARAQAQDYEGHRAMMEAYGLNKYDRATGVVQWMLANPWPGLIWHTYDYYLYPAGTYFGIKKALEPLHVQYSYKSSEVIVNNSLLTPYTGLQVRAVIYNGAGQTRYQHAAAVSVEPDAVTRCFAIPGDAVPDSLYFLRLELKDKTGKTVSLNWYWLSKTADSLNWKKSTWFYTPQSAYADYRGLQHLPPTALQAGFSTERSGTETVQHIRITNTGKALAFFVHLRALKKQGGDDILPVTFSDNYLLLAPGETRNIDCRYLNRDAGNETPFILLSAWNADASRSRMPGNMGLEGEVN
jgi:exo-1,4-beta-D-glucosaminidase